jgi:hypothetical protein
MVEPNPMAFTESYISWGIALSLHWAANHVARPAYYLLLGCVEDAARFPQAILCYCHCRDRHPISPSP